MKEHTPAPQLRYLVLMVIMVLATVFTCHHMEMKLAQVNALTVASE